MLEGWGATTVRLTERQIPIYTTEYRHQPPVVHTTGGQPVEKAKLMLGFFA